MTKRLYLHSSSNISELNRLGYDNFDFLACENNDNDVEKHEFMKILENIHLSYWLGGSNVLSTNTYQVNLYSFREKEISIKKGEEALNTYVDIAYDSLQKYKKIKRNNSSLVNFSEHNYSVYEHLEKFKHSGTKLGIFHENDKVNIKDYLNELKLYNTRSENKNKFKRDKNKYIAFCNGPYNSAFRDLSEYTGILHKEKEKEIITNKNTNNNKKIDNCKQTEKLKVKNNHKFENCIKQNTKLFKNYDIKIKLSNNEYNFISQLNNIEVLPKTKIYNESSYKFSPNVKLYNYGLEYYIDITDEEIISNCKFKLGFFSRNSDKLHLFYLETFSNVREVLIFYNYIKYYGNTFNNNVIISFFCNSPKNVGCLDYSFFDFVSLLLYLDSFSKYIRAIGVNCVNAECVYDLFLPFKIYKYPYSNINIDLYRSPNYHINSISKDITNNLKKNRYVCDVDFFCLPNRLLKNVSYNENGVYFHNTPIKYSHSYNFIEKWLDVNINGFGGCCFHTPYDISIMDYKLGQLS